MLLVLSTVITFFILLPQSRINSNLFDLLPSKEEKYNSQLIDGYLSTLDSQLIWLISDHDHGSDVAAFWSEQLSDIPSIENIQGEKEAASLENYAKSILQYPSLLPITLIEKINSGEYLDWIIAQLYSPFSGISINEIQADPLLSARAYLVEQLKNAGQASMDNGWITFIEADGKQWYLLRAELAKNATGMLQRKEIVTEINQKIKLLDAKFPHHELLQKGSLFYSDYAAKTAEKDITTIGSLSVLGVIIIFFLFFKSWRAISLTLLALSIGILFGTTSVLLVYGEIHLITIVMSTSIIGVAIDYTLFFLTARSLEGDMVSPRQTLKTIFLPLLGALLSTCLAYAVLIFAPFIGLEQLAVFTISGLIAVFFTVISWFPSLAIIPMRKHLYFSTIIENYLSAWKKHQYLIFITTGIIVSLAAYGFYMLKTDDDIGNLQTLPSDILNQDQQIGKILGQQNSQQILMVTGDTPELLLQNIEQSYPLLEQWKNENIIEDYRRLPLFSESLQETHLEALDKFYPELNEYYLTNDINNLALPNLKNTISLENWIDSPLSEGWNLLFQIYQDQESAFIIPITKVNDMDRLIESLIIYSSTLETPQNLFWIDRKNELSDLFTTYREAMQWLLIIALTTITILFMIFKGCKQGLLSAFPVLMANFIPLGILGVMGIPINLFTIMALILVVGMSIDYVLFFGSKNPPKVAFITILLAAVISELTFGLLAASDTNAISNFGLILALGIFTALLLAPYARISMRNSQEP